jgi:hypothetical protein
LRDDLVGPVEAATLDTAAAQHCASAPPTSLCASKLRRLVAIDLDDRSGLSMRRSKSKDEHTAAKRFTLKRCGDVVEARK